MDPVYEERLRDLRAHAALEASNRSTGRAVPWFRPSGWVGDLFDLYAMGEPFSRIISNALYLQAVADGNNPGTTGDLVATTTMIDYLATLERAFRMRHTMRRPRAMAHMLGRKRGHGDTNGTYTAAIEYARELISAAKEPTP